MSREPEQDGWLGSTLRQSPAAATDACLDAETLAAWADGGLTTQAAAAVDLHASNCSRCMAVLAAMERSAPPALAPHAWTPARLFRWLVPLTAAATAIAIWVAVPDRPITPQQTAAVQDLGTTSERADSASQVPVPERFQIRNARTRARTRTQHPAPRTQNRCLHSRSRCLRRNRCVTTRGASAVRRSRWMPQRARRRSWKPHYPLRHPLPPLLRRRPVRPHLQMPSPKPPQPLSDRLSVRQRRPWSSPLLRMLSFAGGLSGPRRLSGRRTAAGPGRARHLFQALHRTSRRAFQWLPSGSSTRSVLLSERPTAESLTRPTAAAPGRSCKKIPKLRSKNSGASPL